MEARRSPQGRMGGLPGNKEHQAIKATPGSEVGKASRWLDLAMALWVQDDVPQTQARSASPPTRAPR